MLLKCPLKNFFGWPHIIWDVVHHKQIIKHYIFLNIVTEGNSRSWRPRHPDRKRQRRNPTWWAIEGQMRIPRPWNPCSVSDVISHNGWTAWHENQKNLKLLLDIHSYSCHIIYPKSSCFWLFGGIETFEMIRKAHTVRSLQIQTLQRAVSSVLYKKVFSDFFFVWLKDKNRIQGFPF